MLEIKNTKKATEMLYYFDDIFPHNQQKVNDYYAWAKKIIDNGHFLVFERNKEIIGIAAYYSNNIRTRIGYISLIGIKKQFQGLGFGRILLYELFSRIKKDGMSHIELEVDKDNNSALTFYLKNHFKIKTERDKTFLLQKDLF